MKTILKIEGMHCAGCVVAIQNYLTGIEGIKECEVNLTTNKAFIEYDPSKIDLKSIEKAIEEVGYKVVYERLTLKIKNITEADVKIIENKLKHDGIKNLSVNHTTSQIYLEYNPAMLSIAEIGNMLAKHGYEILTQDVSMQEDLETKKLKRLVLIGTILTIPITLYSYTQYLPLPLADNASYIMLVLAGIVQILLGSKFYLGAYRIARLGNANMDTLVALGTTVAYAYSVYNTLTLATDLYYEVAAVILTLVLLGKYLENKMKGKASSVIKKLLELQPKNATLVKDGQYMQVPIDLLKPMDIILVKAGEKIPIDGVIIEGYTSIDESMVTGEYLPVNKKEGDKVIGGTINKEGAILVKVEKNVNETLLAQIIKLVEEAIGRKPMLQRLVDKVSGYFTFIVITIAVATFLGWYTFDVSKAIISSITVLLIACPCALGLATPSAVMVGMNKSAQYGVIFKSGEALETLTKINAIVFDKTGTLTKGRLEVTDIIPTRIINGASSELDLLQIAASVESASEHPIANAIVRKANEMNIKLKNVKNVRIMPGRGIKAIIDNSVITIGSIDFMISNDIDISNYNDIIKHLQNEGKTPILVADGKEVVGILGLFDTPKEEAKEVVERFKKKGIRCIMLTGDNQATASKIAKELSIDEVKANVLPDEKANVIKELRKEGKIAMVGDGINDAPALAEADVGIAVTNATDISIESAHVITIRNDLRVILYAYEISRKTMSKIKHNLFYAFVYNTALIPIAALGLLYPTLAGIAMAASSVSVTASSLMLKRWKPRL